MEYLLQKKDEKINELYMKCDQLEQHQYRRDVQVVGLAESSCEEEDLKKILKMSKDKLGLKLKASDLEEVHRLGKKRANKPRDMILRFKEKGKRETFYQNRKKVTENSDTSKRIYINDRLTTYRSGLFYSARKLVKSKKLHMTWSQKGNILVRKCEDGDITQVMTHKDLNSLKDQPTEYSSYGDLSSDVITHLSDYDY